MNVLSTHSSRPTGRTSVSRPANLPEPSALEEQAQVYQDRADLSLSQMRQANNNSVNGIIAAGVGAATIVAGLFVSSADPTAGIAVTVAGTTGMVGGALYSLHNNGKAGRLLGESMSYSSQAARLKIAAAMTRELEG